MGKIDREKYNVDITTEFEAQETPGDNYILTKVVDRFQNIGERHPNGIDNGHTTVGKFLEPPTVGNRFVIQGARFNQRLDTSPVTNIIDEETFETRNSTYKLVPYFDLEL